ncbi:MAG: DMT family transporter [Gammaproteobacteria bacterium]|nr:DMT family transporter [Gammaproteobacteria bacterium]
MLPLTLLSTLGLIWGSAFAIARYVMCNGVSPLIYSFMVVFFPAILMSIHCLNKNNLHKVIFTNPKYYIITALLGIVIPNTNKYYLASHLPSGILAIIVATTPFFIYPLALLFREEKFQLQRLLGSLSASCGILLLAILHSTTHLSINYYLLISFITPISYATCAVYVARFIPQKQDVKILTTGMLIAAAIMLTPVLFTHSIASLTSLTMGTSIAIIAEILLVTTGYLILFKILKNYGSINYSLVDGIAGIVGVFFGYIFFTETISKFIILAIVFIALGIILLKKRKPKLDTNKLHM